MSRLQIFWLGLLLVALVSPVEGSEEEEPKSRLLERLQAHFPVKEGWYLKCSGTSESYGTKRINGAFEVVLPMWPSLNYGGSFADEEDPVENITSYFEGILSSGFRNRSQPQMIHSRFPETVSAEHLTMPSRVGNMWGAIRLCPS